MQKLTAQIGLRAASFLVVSTIIGSGVFKKIAPMSAELGSPLLVIVCWVLAGLISLAGALCTAEMSSMFPSSGGEYFYFKKIYGRFFSFLYGWANFAVLKTASIAALAYIFAQSLNSLVPFPAININFKPFGWHVFENASIKIFASLLILLLTYVNYRGVLFAERLSRMLAYLMFAGIIVFLLVGFFSTQSSFGNFSKKSEIFDSTNSSAWTILKGLMVASLGAFWGYEGWNTIGFIGEEIKNPRRNLPIALATGTGIVILTYVSLNIMFLYSQPIDFFIELNKQPNKIAAVEVARFLSGNIGAIVIACLILVTTLNATNSTILMSARILFAMARDKVFFTRAASIHSTYKTPDFALLLQGLWSIVLVWSGSFDQLTDMLIFASFIYYGSTSLGLIIMRRREPNRERLYRVPGYPLVPALFTAFCLSIFIVTIFNQPYEAFWGIALIGTGIPVYYFIGKKVVKTSVHN